MIMKKKRGKVLMKRRPSLSLPVFKATNDLFTFIAIVIKMICSACLQDEEKLCSNALTIGQ